MSLETTPTPKASILGPFLGYVTASSVKVWLHLEGGAPDVYITIHSDVTGAPIAEGKLTFRHEQLWTDCTSIDGLSPESRYFYKLWTNAAYSIPLDLQGLKETELCFRTLPQDDDNAQIDFLLMSCHNPPASEADGFNGFAIWADIPQIIAGESNKNVRFALLIGDQIYADDWKDRILATKSDADRIALYLDAYRTFWSNIHYRRVLCSLPAMLMWDDHDIVDGWGSTLESFLPGKSEFREDWLKLFDAASSTFAIMQNIRNPLPLSSLPGDGYDFCFRIGKWGFAVLDLRSHRNLLQNRIISVEQIERLKKWVEANKKGMEALFVVSTVVFSHGSPPLDDFAVSLWPFVMSAVDWLARLTKWGRGMRTNFYKTLGDIRDDIRDSWGCKENAAQADLILDYLFALQNEPHNPMNVVILCGDIHTPGYANIYSSDPAHSGRATIPHITASPVAYSPFNWLVEAVYRNASKTVALGQRGAFSSQISHHFCARSVTVLSLRPTTTGHQLKVKYYLEGYPEPQILLFDLDRVSHRENITWVAQETLFDKDYAPSISFDLETVLAERAGRTGLQLDWQNSIVDLMKTLDMDSGLGARKKLAQEWGYQGTLNGSSEMNIWLHQQMMQRFIASRGETPDGQLRRP